MEKFFKLKENNTTVSTEITAGITTFFAMAYIIAVNPSVLSATGMEWGAVFLATIIAAIIGTLVMGLFANVPYAQAPGMGLNAFFTYTVCFGLGFTWQQAMSMVFICGLLNILITVTKVRKMIIKAIPKSLQLAISGGIGAFIAYLGFLNVGMIQFSPDETQPALAVPGIASFNTPVLWVFLIGLVLAIVLTVKNVRGGSPAGSWSGRGIRSAPGGRRPPPGRGAAFPGRGRGSPAPRRPLWTPGSTPGCSPTAA